MHLPIYSDAHKQNHPLMVTTLTLGNNKLLRQGHQEQSVLHTYWEHHKGQLLIPIPTWCLKAQFNVHHWWSAHLAHICRALQRPISDTVSCLMLMSPNWIGQKNNAPYYRHFKDITKADMWYGLFCGAIESIWSPVNDKRLIRQTCSQQYEG